MKEGRKRKRAPHHTACQECHRLHRSCDGERPCRRCVAVGKEDVCQPIQRKPYTRKPKPSGQWLSQQAFSIFNQPSNQLLPISPAFTSSATFASVTSTNSQIEGDNQRLLSELFHQVKQVQEMTQSLQLRQQLLTKQLISLKPSQPSSHEDRFDTFNELLDAQSSSPDMSPPNNSSPLLFDSPIQLFEIEPTSELASSDTHQEMLDLMEVSHDPIQGLAFPVSHDAVAFQESLFVPFAITDAAKVPFLCLPSNFFFCNAKQNPQPFYVFNFSIDWDLVLKAHQDKCEPHEHFSATILSANLSFCQMSQYQMVEYSISSFSVLLY